MSRRAAHVKGLSHHHWEHCFMKLEFITAEIISLSPHTNTIRIINPPLSSPPRRATSQERSGRSAIQIENLSLTDPESRTTRVRIGGINGRISTQALQPRAPLVRSWPRENNEHHHHHHHTACRAASDNCSGSHGTRAFVSCFITAAHTGICSVA